MNPNILGGEKGRGRQASVFGERGDKKAPGY